MANRWRKNGHSDRFIFLGSKNTADGDCSHEIKRCLLLGRKAMTNLDSESKSWDVTLMTKSPYSQSVSSSHVWMWELDHKGGWAPKNRCIRTAVLENTLESPLDCKEIKPVNAKGNQSWMFTGRTDAETEAPILWPPDAKSQLTGIDSDAGKDRRQEEKGTTEDDMVGWHHQLYGHEFEPTPRDGEGKGSLACAVHGIAKSQTQLSGRTTEQQQVAVKKSLKAPKKVKSLMVVSSIPLLAI